MLSSLNAIVSRLRLKHLRLLIALDEQGSLHRAAQLVSISQPGASKALHDIETAFGATLFVRTSQGLQANDLGHCVIRYARLIHSDLAHLREEMVGILEGQGGRLSVGVIMGAVPLLTQMVKSLRQSQPALSIDIVEDTSARLLALLDEGRLDLAICRSTVSRRPDAYDCLALHDEAVEIVAHPCHPLATQTEVDIGALAQYSWVTYPIGMPMRLLLEREFAAAGLDVPRYGIETASTFTMLSLLNEDPTLLALMPSKVAEFGVQFGLVKPVPFTIAARNEPYGVIVRRGVPLSPPAELLMQELAGLSSHS